jgi:hypothetical protein
VNAENWAAVAAIAQAATVVVAGWALIYSRGQVLQARLTRERVAQPNVVVYVDRHEVRRYMDVVIKNFGQTPAYNVRVKVPPLQIVPYRDPDTREQVTSVPLPESIAVLAPGQEWRTVWDSYMRRKRHKGALQDQFVGHVKYDDKLVPDKPSFCNPVSLDFKMFRNTTWITENKGQTVQKALYEIAGTLEKYGRDDKGVWVYTAPADEELRRREQEYEESLRDQEEFYRDLGVIQDDPVQEDDTKPDDSDEDQD